MKLQLKSHSKSYLVETETDDLTIDEYFDIFIGLLFQAGFHKETIDRAIVELAESIKD